jgi:endonuclease-3
MKSLTVKQRQLQERALKIIHQLKIYYPQAHCSLFFKNPFELICATILSAQCTDERVNQVVPELFRQFPTPEAMAQASLEQLETIIRSTGFYKNKAKSLKTCAQQIVQQHHGQVPKTRDELIALAGVGRKTANVVLGNAYGIPGFVVDTHVGRIVRRLGLTRQTDPVKVELEMMKVIPESEWIQFSHWIIAHGRAVCTARVAKCDECPLFELCPRVGV